MKRATFLIALATACTGAPPAVEPPPRPEPAPDEPIPAPDPIDAEDASAPPEELAATDDRDPKGDPLATDPTSPVEAGGANGGPGKLDPAVIQRVVRGHVPRIKACYQRVLAKHADAKGQLRVQFVIGNTGVVTSAAIDRGSGIPELDACVMAIFIKMQFPPPTGGSVNVRYPFVFAST
jgi:TonB family protein